MTVGTTHAPQYLITVDGGWSTVCASWSGSWLPDCKSLNLPQSMKGKRASKEDKLRHMWTRFADYLDMDAPNTERVVIEDVELWSEALISLTAAERGDLFTLAQVIAGYCAECAAREITFELVQAKTWKGQLTKYATRKRIERFWRGIDLSYSDAWFSEHAYDAIGIGLYKAGVF